MIIPPLFRDAKYAQNAQNTQDDVIHPYPLAGPVPAEGE